MTRQGKSNRQAAHSILSEREDKTKMACKQNAPGRYGSLTHLAVALATGLIAVLLLPAVALAGPSNTFAFEFGEEGTGNGQFDGPAGMATEAAGNLYVADQSNHRIQVFNPKGEYRRQFGEAGSGDGQLSVPSGLAVDAAGDIYVADSGNHRVQVFNPNGEYLSQFGEEGTGNGQFRFPSDIAFDSQGNIYVLDAWNGRVQKFNSDAEYQGQFGEPGSGDGQFGIYKFLEVPMPAGIATVTYEPFGITVIAVADTYNDRVQLFTIEGEYLSQFGETGSEVGQFEKPKGIDADSAGNIYVADTGNDRVQKHDTGSEDTVVGSMSSNRGVATSGHSLWVTTEDKIEKWALPGYYSPVFAPEEAGMVTPYLDPPGGSFPAEFSVADEAAVTLYADETTVTCTTKEEVPALTGSGEFTNSTTATAQLTFHHCKLQAFSVNCTTSGQEAGTIVTEELSPQLRFLPDHRAAVLFTPKEGGGALATFKCSFLVSAEIKGAVLGRISAPHMGEPSPTLTVEANAPEGEQEYTEVLGGAEYELESSVNGAEFTAAALDAEPSFSFAEEGEAELPLASTYPRPFAVSGGSAVMDAPQMTFSCSGSTGGSGSFANEAEGEITLEYHGCTFTSPGEESGTIVTSPLEFSVVYADDAHQEPSLLLEPAGEDPFAEFKCYGVTCLVSGSLIAPLNGPGFNEAAETFEFETDQGPQQVEEDGESHYLELSINEGEPGEMTIDASYAGALEESGQFGGQFEFWPYPYNPNVPQPELTTQEASEVRAHKATVNAEIDGQGYPAFYQVQYGTSKSYGSKAPVPRKQIHEEGAVAVSAQLENLAESTTYHYRVVAGGAYETKYGPDQEFTTEAEPDTSFTSPTPTYTSDKLPRIDYTAEPVPEVSFGIDEVEFSSSKEGSTFKCWLTSEPADEEVDFSEETCESGYELPELSTTAWRTFKVIATDEHGQVESTPASWTFKTAIYPDAPEASKLISPEEGEKSASHFTLRAEWGAPPEGGGVTGVTFQVKDGSMDNFETLREEYVQDGEGNEVSWPMPVDGGSAGKSDPIFVDADALRRWYEQSKGSWTTRSLEGDLSFRAVFDGGKNAAGASKPVATELIEHSGAWRSIGAATDATEQLGPVSVDLLTGNFTISRTDVSIPVPGTEANLEFTRTFESNYYIEGINNNGDSRVLGFSWQPGSPMESEYEGEAWSLLAERHQDAQPDQYDEECEEIWEELKGTEYEFPKEECLIEYAIPEADWIELRDNEGAEASFEIDGSNYIAPEYMNEYTLSKQGSGEDTTFELSSPEGTRTVFVENSYGVGGDYVPDTVSWQATEKSARMVYKNFQFEEGGQLYFLLAKMISPDPAGVECKDASSTTTAGCRTLTFQYFSNCGCAWEPRLESIKYYNSSGSGSGTKVSEYAYDEDGRLTEQWDPRISPALKETYSYKPWESYTLLSLTPPGENPWEFAYHDYASGWEGRLESVSRENPAQGEIPASTATTTISYEVALSGEDAPYEMSPSTVAEWGQSDYPVNATAIFPPTQVPEDPDDPEDYDQATIHYLDPDGQEVNTAVPAPPGVEGDVISTDEVDRHGNIVRSLSASSRLEALAAEDPLTRAKELDSHATYNDEGTRMEESWGPLHEVRLENGETKEARSHTKKWYDEGFTPTKKEEEDKTPAPNLPTKEKTGAAIPGGEEYADEALSETKYDWDLRKPTEQITDPEGLKLVEKTVYHPKASAFAGFVKQASQPSDSEGKEAGTAKTIYWTAGSNSENSSCGNKAKWAGLICLARPVAEPSPAGTNPKLPWVWTTEYNSDDLPTKEQEKINGVVKRTSTFTYDTAGRLTKTKTTGEGTEVPASEIVYDEDTGEKKSQHFVCEAEECAEFDTEEISAITDDLGRTTSYTDADGNKSTFIYDLVGRPVIIWDGKGYQTVSFDETSNVPTEVTDSAAGTFEVSYNADAQIIEQVLPNGITQQLTYDDAGQAVGLAYEKEGYCGASCTWLSFERELSIGGKVLHQESTLSEQDYSYDKAGRLTLAKDTEGGQCTTRAYAFEENAGKNSNRTKKVTREPKEGGGCDTESEGEVQEYEYDTADRLLGEGVQYDNLGRITALPAEYSGAGELTTSYFVNDLTRSQTQDGITNTYELDSTLRQRERTRVKGEEESTEIYHYSGNADSPVWTEEGEGWTRNIQAMGGALGALQRSDGEIAFQLADMHGDIVATADDDPETEELLSTHAFDEFGNPKGEGTPKYGWLGANMRRTELPSGVIQMGVRSYIPALGRFLTADPVPGGSANAYDYANQDPVNNFDLTGERLCTTVARAQVCGYGPKELARAIRKKQKQQTRRVLRKRWRRYEKQRVRISPKLSGRGASYKGAFTKFLKKSYGNTVARGFGAATAAAQWAGCGFAGPIARTGNCQKKAQEKLKEELGEAPDAAMGCGMEVIEELGSLASTKGLPGKLGKAVLKRNWFVAGAFCLKGIGER